jgi:cytochrome c551/c552
MKTLVVAMLAASVSLLAVPAVNAADDALKAGTCTNCHDVDKKKVGPSLKDIGAKGGDAAALTAKIKDGKGHPKVNKPEADIKAGVDAALATK